MKLILVIGLAFLLQACGFEQVDEGYRGIFTRFGKVEGEPLAPGLQFYNPITSNVFEISVREEKIEGKTDVFTKDTQTVTLTYVVTFYPDQNKIGQIFSQFGRDWESKVISPAVLGSIKDSVGQYIADELVYQRKKVTDAAFQEIRAALATRNVTVTRLDITNLDFNDEYEKAVEAKVVATQRAAEEKNKTVQVEEQAKQTVKAAEAAATSMRIRSQALAQNKGLVQYEAVQKWDGKLPQIQLGGGSMPILDLKGLMSKNGAE